MDSLTYTIPPDQEGRTVKSLLRGELHFSNALYKSLKWRSGAILLNGRPVAVSVPVKSGDVLTVALAERRPPSSNIVPCELPLRIVFEDDYLLVLDKPAGAAMHSRSGGSGLPTVAGALRSRLGPETAAHFVNRLDRGTSGLCAAAKSGYIHDRLRQALHTDGLYREYRAFVWGRVEPSRGIIDLPIGPAEGLFYRRCIRPDGQPARTEYEVLAQGDRLAYLRLVPRTGRTHQLRVHMSALGHPLAGDGLYGGAEAGGISRPALHSWLLRFVHPVTGEPLSFTAPLPEDMASLAGELSSGPR